MEPRLLINLNLMEAKVAMADKEFKFAYRKAAEAERLALLHIPSEDHLWIELEQLFASIVKENNEYEEIQEKADTQKVVVAKESLKSNNKSEPLKTPVSNVFFGVIKTALTLATVAMLAKTAIRTIKKTVFASKTRFGLTYTFMGAILMSHLGRAKKASMQPNRQILRAGLGRQTAATGIFARIFRPVVAAFKLI